MKYQIIKIGGSVITGKDEEVFYNKKNTKRIADEIYSHNPGCILIHGTGNFGKPPAIEYGYYESGMIKKENRLIALKIKDSLRQLNQLVVSTLLSSNVPVLPIDILHFYTVPDKEIQLSSLSLMIKEVVSRGIVPVFNGDIMPLANGNFKVLSSDIIALILAKTLYPDSVIFLSDVDGVYLQSHYDKKNNNKVLAKTLNSNNIHLMYKNEDDLLDVSGGMREKARIALEISKYCSRCFIGNGYANNVLSDFLNGRKIIGTYVENK
jgi:isopentenyl phosphate kinase